MPVPVSMQDLSVTAAINSPAGSESPISTDNHHRATQAILRHTQARGADIASATTTDIGAATGYSFNITGTTTITSLGTIAAGILRQATFTGALTLTHNATSLILPSSANITTAAGDVAEFTSLGSGNWKCTSYTRQNGASVSAVGSDEAYGAGWNGSLEAPTKNAVYDKIESLSTTVPDASQTVKGIVELATNAEVVTGSDTTRAVTPSALKNYRETNLVSKPLGILTFTNGSTSQTLSGLDLTNYSMVLIFILTQSANASAALRLDGLNLYTANTGFNTGLLSLNLTTGVVLGSIGQTSTPYTTNVTTTYSKSSTSLVFTLSASSFFSGTAVIMGVV